MIQNPFIEIGLPVSLFIIMIGIGLTLSVADFMREAKQPRGLIAGSLSQIVVLPMLSFVIAWGLDLPPAIAVGLVIVAACPGGATSNVIAYMARGNVALSIIMTVIASLATIVSLPIFVNLALTWQFGEGTDVQMPVIKTVILLTVIVLIPVALGMTLKALAPKFALRLETPLNLFGALVLLALILLISWSVRDRFLILVAQGGMAAVALNTVGITVGIIFGRFFGLGTRDQLTLGIELGIKNTTIGLLVATTILHSAEMAVPAMVYGLTMYGFGAMLVAYGRRRFKEVPQQRLEDHVYLP